MRWPWSKPPDPFEYEFCDDCGKPAVTRQGDVFLCGGCAWHEDDDMDDEPRHYYDSEEFTMNPYITHDDEFDE